MLGVEVLRAEDLPRVHHADDPSGFAQIPTSDDSVSNSDNDTNKSTLITELNLNEESVISSQTDYVSKMKNIKCSHGQKPYDLLSEREKQRLMERQSRRVLRLREETRRYGVNRFILQISNNGFMKFNDQGVVGHRRRENSTCSVGSLDSCEDFSSSFEEEEELERNLGSWYQSGCDKDYFGNDTSRWDLVKNYMDMEDKIEELQKSLTHTRLEQKTSRLTFNVEAEMEKIRVFREEIETLMRENDVLQTENEKLRLRLPSKTG